MSSGRNVGPESLLTLVFLFLWRQCVLMLRRVGKSRKSGNMAQKTLTKDDLPKSKSLETIEQRQNLSLRQRMG